jgi:hypothetical protein
MDHAPISLYSKQDPCLSEDFRKPAPIPSIGNPVSRRRPPRKVRDLRLALFTRPRRAPNLRLREHLVRGLPRHAVALAKPGHLNSHVPCLAHTVELCGAAFCVRTSEGLGIAFEFIKAKDPTYLFPTRTKVLIEH